MTFVITMRQRIDNAPRYAEFDMLGNVVALHATPGAKTQRFVSIAAAEHMANHVATQHLDSVVGFEPVEGVAA